MATATLIAPDEEPATLRVPLGRREYHCECGYVLRFSGGGRHRVYFDPGDTGSQHPVLNRVCPACQHVLLGKNRF